uniref:Uncharacterized protein n=1 Tax=Chaetoceros debilis TaxID=122233 RepID=A0A7S3Q5G9_9STRA
MNSKTSSSLSRQDTSRNSSRRKRTSKSQRSRSTRSAHYQTAAMTAALLYMCGGSGSGNSRSTHGHGIFNSVHASMTTTTSTNSRSNASTNAGSSSSSGSSGVDWNGDGSGSRHSGSYSSSSATSASASRVKSIPQHRVRTSKRAINYGPDHPWESDGNSSTNANANTSVNTAAPLTLVDRTLESKEKTNDSDGSSAGSESEEDEEGENEKDEEGEAEFEPGGLTEELKGVYLDEEVADADTARILGPEETHEIRVSILNSSILQEYLPKSNIMSWSVQSHVHEQEKSKPLSSVSGEADESQQQEDQNKEQQEQKKHKHIRIRATLLEDDSTGYAFLSTSERNIMLTNIVQPMMKHWSHALKVIPIQDNLALDGDQLFDGESCGPGLDSGLPSVRIPLDHLHTTEPVATNSAGIGDTDLVIYVSVGFRDAEWARRRRQRKRLLEEASGYADADSNLNEEIIANKRSRFFKALREQDGADIATNTGRGTDMGSDGLEDETVTTTETSNTEEPVMEIAPACSGHYLASATYCNTDQYDRPVAGLLHLCLGPEFFDGYDANAHLDMKTVFGRGSGSDDQGTTISGGWSKLHAYASTESDGDDDHQNNLHQVAVLHEIGHILGFNSQSLAHFRDGTTGEPITPRDENGDVVDTAVQCTGVVEMQLQTSSTGTGENMENVTTSGTTPVGEDGGEDAEADIGNNKYEAEDPIAEPSLSEVETEVGRGRTAVIPLPSQAILRFRNDVRGGLRVARIVTPTVRQVVRNHFDCQELDGAELESAIAYIDVSYGDIDEAENSDRDSSVQNQSYFVDECISDHWERRLFKADLMNPIVDSVSPSSYKHGYISPLTLAYFLDSGWYEIDVFRSAEPDSWGRGAGCDFVNNDCITDAGLVASGNSKFFCNPQSNGGWEKYADDNIVDGCTDDMTSKASCSIMEYDRQLPSVFQHFESAVMGGSDAGLDYCPSYIGIPDGSCEDKDQKSYRIEEVGSTSRCITGQIGKKNAALCVPVACVVEDRSLRIRVDEEWKECKYEGEVIDSYYDLNDYVSCPDPVQTCPSFYCPRNCLTAQGVGVCDIISGDCDCMGTDAVGACTGRDVFDFKSLVEVETVPNYLLYSDNLENDEKDIFDQAARMFLQMTPGEVIGFVTASLLVVGGCFVVVTTFVKVVKDRRFLPRFVPQFWKKDWRVDNRSWNIPVPSFGTSGTNSNKQKVVASVLHNMRVEDVMSDCFIDERDDDGTSTNISVNRNIIGTIAVEEGERIFYRSELPPLPGVGRIVSIVGSRYIDDSIVPDDADDNMTLDGTAEYTGTGTSNILGLNSDHGTEGYIDEENIEEQRTSSFEHIMMPPTTNTLMRRRVNRRNHKRS